MEVNLDITLIVHSIHFDIDFTYPGCKGNGNRFETVEECVNTCGGTSAPVEDDSKCQDVNCDANEKKVSETSM